MTSLVIFFSIFAGNSLKKIQKNLNKERKKERNKQINK